MGVLLATSIGPEKEYCKDLLRTAMQLQGVTAAAVACDFNGPRWHIPAPAGIPAHMFDVDPPKLATIQGRCAYNRAALREYFLRGEWDYLYWHDCDMLPPTDIVPRLLELNTPVSAGLYVVRGSTEPIFPILNRGRRRRDNGQTHDMQLRIDERGLMNVAGYGMGCMLVSRKAIEMTPFRGPMAFDGSMSEDFAWCVDSGTGVVVDSNIPVWHVDSDGTGVLPRLGETDAITIEKRG